MYKKITVSNDIPERKLKNAIKKGLMSLTAQELKGSGATMMVHPETWMKVKKALKNNKGTRLHITPEEVRVSLQEGGSVNGSAGSIWQKIKGVLKDLWEPVLKPMISGALDIGSQALGAYTGRPELVNAGRQAVRRFAGVGVKGSPEMKQYMASIRAKRGSKRGGSFRLE